VIDQIILPRLHIRRRRKVHPVRLTHILNLLPRPRHAQNILMELRQIPPNNLRRIPRRVTRDENIPHNALTLLLFHSIDHAGHLVQFLGADVWAVRETEVDERVFAFQVFGAEVFAVVVGQVESAADERFADSLVLCGDAGARHAGFFVAEVEGEAGAGGEEEEACLPGERLAGVLVFLLGFWYGLQVDCAGRYEMGRKGKGRTYT
jgi:hypothetical protein